MSYIMARQLTQKSMSDYQTNRQNESNLYIDNSCEMLHTNLKLCFHIVILHSVAFVIAFNEI